MNPNADRRALWRDAVWGSDLEPMQKLVALAFEKYAGASVDEVWVSWPELMRLTGLSRDSVSRALRTLVPAGWLVVVERARQHRSARYALRIPRQQSDSRTPQQSDDRTPEPLQQSDSRTPGVTQQSDPAFQQSDPAVSAVRLSDPNSKRTTNKNHNNAAAAPSDDPLEEYRLTDEQRADFMAYIGARSDGLLVHLARAGDLAIRVAEWQTARDTHPRAERSEWDRYPSTAELRARDEDARAHTAPPGRGAEIMRQARQRPRRPSEIELLTAHYAAPSSRCPYCGRADSPGHPRFNCPAWFDTAEPAARTDPDWLPPRRYCTTCGAELPCPDHDETNRGEP